MSGPNVQAVNLMELQRSVKRRLICPLSYLAASLTLSDRKNVNAGLTPITEHPQIFETLHQYAYFDLKDVDSTAHRDVRKRQIALAQAQLNTIPPTSATDMTAQPFTHSGS